jgi:hypothetical protein
MREPALIRLAYGVFAATAIALLVAFANPADRIKADLRADAQGFALSFEYSAAALGKL